MQIGGQWLFLLLGLNCWRHVFKNILRFSTSKVHKMFMHFDELVFMKQQEKRSTWCIIYARPYLDLILIFKFCSLEVICLMWKTIHSPHFHSNSIPMRNGTSFGTLYILNTMDSWNSCQNKPWLRCLPVPNRNEGGLDKICMYDVFWDRCRLFINVYMIVMCLSFVFIFVAVRWLVESEFLYGLSLLDTCVMISFDVVFVDCFEWCVVFVYLCFVCHVFQSFAVLYKYVCNILHVA